MTSYGWGSGTSFKWRETEYDRQGLKEALESHLSDLQDEFLSCGGSIGDLSPFKVEVAQSAQIR